MMTKIKKYIIAFLFGSVALAAGLSIPQNNSFEKLDRVEKIGEKYEIGFKDGAKVKIGGSESDFKPYAKLSKWDNEVELDVWLETKKKIKPKQENGKLKWKEKEKEVHFYTIDDDKFEFEVILNERPANNIIELKIKSKGLGFHYQPELTDEEKNNGAIRDENLIGSYAVYHKTKSGDYTVLGGKNYMTGKAFQIFRPKIIDSVGNEIWGILKIYPENEKLTVEIPIDFLNNAVYPINHATGLTFGYEISGTTGWYEMDDDIRASTFTSGIAGTGDTINAYVGAFSSSYYGNMKMALYSDSDESLIGGTNEVYVDWDRSPGAWTGNISFTGSPSISAASDYWLAGWSTNFVYIAFDSFSGYRIGEQSIAYGGWPDPFIPGTSTGRKYSIYCTYTAGAAAERRIINIQ